MITPSSVILRCSLPAVPPSHVQRFGNIANGAVGFIAHKHRHLLFWVNIFVIGQYTITWLNLPLSGVDTLQSMFLPGLGRDLAVGQPVLGVLVG